jgi:diguanylate cyclase (GGDEF)-like protein
LNRRSFDEALPEAFARMRRLGEDVVLLMIDIDHFKRVNDTYGHSAGDSVLRAVSQVVASSLREVDKAFRIGGEEFAVLLQGTDSDSAIVAAERLRMAIAEREVSVDGAVISATASIGLAVSRRSMNADALLRVADRALYRAKAGGRNRVIMAGDRAEAPSVTTH